MLKPAVTLEIELYSEAQIAAWDQEDLLPEHDRAAILDKLGMAP